MKMKQSCIKKICSGITILTLVLGLFSSLGTVKADELEEDVTEVTSGYQIIIGVAQEGEVQIVDSDITLYSGGEHVKVALTPTDGYIAGGITVRNAETGEGMIELRSNSESGVYEFSMPYTDVILTGIFDTVAVSEVEEASETESESSEAAENIQAEIDAEKNEELSDIEEYLKASL